MFTLLLGFVAWSAADAGEQKAEPPFDVVPLQGSEITADTGEKPQSKLWLHDGCWWAVFPNAAGTNLWRLDDTRWSSMLHLSDSTDTHADARRVGGLAHVLLLGNARCELVSLEYSPAAKTYHLWPKCPAPVSFTLDAAWNRHHRCRFFGAHVAGFGGESASTYDGASRLTRAGARPSRWQTGG